MLLNVNRSLIYTIFDISYINDYVQYIIELFKQIIIKNDLQINIVLGNTNYEFNNNYKVIKFNINFEHTLVTPPDPLYLVGKIPTNDDKLFLIRIFDYNVLNQSDIVIDYSIPNIYNIYTNPEHNIFLQKMVYFSPALYKYDLQNYQQKHRTNNILTTFINKDLPRRKILIDRFLSAKLNHINVNNCFDKTQLQQLYLNTKIIINIRQSEYCHTFEELRVLPALLSGVIVISEQCPLTNLIPYNELIIWSSYDDIIETCIKVMNNYEKYYNDIFNNKNKEILCSLHQNNIKKMTNMIC
jgi:hypothetical protein